MCLPSLVDHHQPVLYNSFIGKVTLLHSHSFESANRWIELQHPMYHPLTASRSTTSMYFFNLARLQPASASPNSCNYSLTVHLKVHSLTASKSSNLPWSQPASASPNSLNYNMQLHHQSHWITESECIFKFTSRCISKLTRSQPPSVFPNSVNHRLRVSLWVCSIIFFRHTSYWSEAQPTAGPDIPCVDE